MSDAFFRRSNADLEKKLDTELLTVGGLVVHRLRTQNHAAAYRLVFEDLGSGTAYIGRAVPGTADADPVWEIRKLLTSGANIEILWANGSEAFDKIWTNRASYTYS